MKLVGLKLHNFRGYKDLNLDLDKNLNVIVGRNDVGKSTIIEALSIFFDNGVVKIDEYDWNVTSDKKSMSITCVFKIITKEYIVVDNTIESSLKNEFLLNKENNLEIKKEWVNGKSGRPTLYINSFYPTAFKENPIILKTQIQLRKQYREVKDKSLYKPVNENINSELRKGIYSSQFDINDIKSIDREEIFLKLEKGLKDIGENIIKNELPFFYLFKSDRNNSVKDDEIQDPLKVITEQVLNEMKDEIQSMQTKVKAEVEEVGLRTVEMLKELGGDIIGSDIKPKVELKPLTKSFEFDIISNDNIPLDKRGSGVRRLVLLSYFRAEAEKECFENKGANNIIYAIEEPETSQHPNFQNMIMESLIELSNRGKYQIIITTHTPEFAKMIEPNKLIFIDKNSDGPTIVKNTDEKIRKIKESLGILPRIDYKVIIHVEGPNDVNFIKNINKIPEINKIICLDEFKIPIIPLYGGNLISYIEKNYYEGSDVKEIHIYDGDREDTKKIITEINKTEDFRRKGFITECREMENYIPKKYIEEYFQLVISSKKEEYSQLNIPKYILENCHNINKYGNKAKDQKKKIKMILNGSISKKITKKDLEEMNLWDEVKLWFETIKTEFNN